MHGTTIKKTITDLAAGSLADAGDDVHAATELLHIRISADMELYKLLMDPLVAQACYDKIRTVIRKERGKIWLTPRHVDDPGKRMKHMAAGNLLMFRLPTAGNKLLGQAIKEEVQAASKWYFSQGENMPIKGRWLELIADKMPRGKTVESGLTEQELRRLQYAAAA